MVRGLVMKTIHSNESVFVFLQGDIPLIITNQFSCLVRAVGRDSVYVSVSVSVQMITFEQKYLSLLKFF